MLDDEYQAEDAAEDTSSEYMLICSIVPTTTSRTWGNVGSVIASSSWTSLLLYPTLGFVSYMIAENQPSVFKARSVTFAGDKSFSTLSLPRSLYLFQSGRTSPHSEYFGR